MPRVAVRKNRQPPKGGRIRPFGGGIPAPQPGRDRSDEPTPGLRPGLLSAGPPGLGSANRLGMVQGFAAARFSTTITRLPLSVSTRRRPSGAKARPLGPMRPKFRASTRTS